MHRGPSWIIGPHLWEIYIYIYPESQDTSMPSSAIAPENNVITIENDHDCRFG